MIIANITPTSSAFQTPGQLHGIDRAPLPPAAARRLQSVINHLGHTAEYHTITKCCRQQTEQYIGVRTAYQRAWRVLWHG